MNRESLEATPVPKALFPSLAWFQVLRTRMNNQSEKYRHIGAMDLRMAVVIRGQGILPGDYLYGMCFEEYRCAEVRELKTPEEIDPDFILEGGYTAWKEMVENIRTHGRADISHTLNSLTLLDHPFLAHGPDQTRVDLFARMNFSLQEFFDEAAAVETQFSV